MCSFEKKKILLNLVPVSNLYSCWLAYAVCHWSLLSLAVPLHDCDLYPWILFHFSSCSFSDHFSSIICRFTQDAIFISPLFSLLSPSFDKVIHLYSIPYADNPNICDQPSPLSRSPKRMNTKKWHLGNCCKKKRYREKS